MASPFVGTPAGTPVPPTTSARYYTRNQVFSRVPISGTNFTSGKQASFVTEATGGRHLVFNESRLVVKFKAKSGTLDAGGVAPNFLAADRKVEKSVRLAADPVTNMFSAGMLSINGTTIASTQANLADVSMLQLRTEHTKAGADGGGSAGLLSFNQKMTPEDVQADAANLDSLAGGSAVGQVTATAAATVPVLKTNYTTTDERSDKHELMVNNFSGDGKAVDGSDASSLEISVPLGQLFPFARTDVFPTGVQTRIDLTISDTHRQDMFYSEILRGQAGAAGIALHHAPAVAHTIGAGATGNGYNFASDVDVATYIRPVPAATNPPVLEIEEIFLDCMMAIPSAPLGPPKSLQISYQDINVYTRQLGAGETFVEQFTSIPPSIGAIVVGLRSSEHGLTKNRELYELGGGPKGFSQFSCALGALQLPQPAFQLDMQSKACGRAFSDWLSFIGGSYANGVGGEGASLTSWTKSPLIAVRMLQDPGAYASTLTLRFNTKTALTAGDHPELVLWTISSEVVEMFWDSQETFPSRVIKDSVLN
jgi:hypothetical protein